MQDLGRIVGASSELRFLMALQAHTYTTPSWFYKVRRATSEQDHEGIDAVAELDVGEVFVQIKSSFAGLEKYVEKHPENRDVIIIVVRADLTDSQIREKTYDFLYRQRGRMISTRRKERRAAHR